MLSHSENLSFHQTPSYIVSVYLRRAPLGFGNVVYGVNWPFARAAILPDGILVKKRRLIRPINREFSLLIRYEEVNGLMIVPRGVVIEIDQRRLPERYGRRRNRDYTCVSILIPRKKARREFIEMLKESYERARKAKLSDRSITKEKALPDTRTSAATYLPIVVGSVILAALLVQGFFSGAVVFAGPLVIVSIYLIVKEKKYRANRKDQDGAY